MFLRVRSTFRHWMLLSAAFLCLVSLPIFGFLAYALWTLDIGRLLLGGMVLAGYWPIALLVVKICIMIDEQMLRHERLRPDAHGNYERPLHKQPEPALQFELSMVQEAAADTDTTARGIPLDGILSQERGYTAR